MDSIISTPLFGIALSLLAFDIGCIVYKKAKLPIFNPIIVSTSIIILFLLKFDISIEDYNKGADFISFLLGPATIVLAVPLYKQLHLLKANSVAIISGITVGCITSIVSVAALSNIMGLDSIIGLSVVPKAITTPIGIELSKQIGGIPALTVVTIILVGNIGYAIAPFVCRLFGIKDKVAVGVSIGTSSHALGTTRAMELGEVEGAMSGLSIGLAGIFTVLLVPIVLKLINFI
ncbi:TIGR00659 family protein [Peptoclostridium litorale DSM 5388]|uniref:Antiholin-like protein LrgB n=1 Tax=Peptoclostridium litorale DSM 5388 TaxID=1121324 RepID=A0A069REY7_PEPLI|nr:LrgB family protein [Peptoclostridium litorale]KDR95576.1 antiholin-like protein LrgB [Peptoclostridium litorale DSM 5388]SIN98626.1 TIGR00659 family protein [Peptoclostridium litorale DSM 5388]